MSDIDDCRQSVERLTRDRGEVMRAGNDKTLLAEVERLREALVLGSEVLASHQGSPQREWHSAGAWLYPGDSINVVRAPLPRNRGRAMSEDKIARAALEGKP